MRKVKYVSSNSKDGRFSPIYSKELSNLINSYCFIMDLNRTQDSERVLMEYYTQKIEELRKK